MTAHDIIDGHLIVTQEKAKQPLRIVISGKLAALVQRIKDREANHSMVAAALLVNTHGKRLTAPVLRNHFDDARKKAALEAPELAAAIKEFWFYDLRAKAADDTSDDRGDQAASDLLGHDSVKTTQRHYLRRGKLWLPLNNRPTSSRAISDSRGTRVHCEIFWRLRAPVDFEVKSSANHIVDLPVRVHKTEVRFDRVERHFFQEIYKRSVHKGRRNGIDTIE
jgi:hypothetical protein